MPRTFPWQGKHEFLVVGTDHHEDTLRIKSNNWRQQEKRLKLLLPTLSITYADMQFINRIGGQQRPFPDSAAYGPAFFNPPITLTGPNIEKLTWIRGAQRVTIGPAQTEVEWWLGDTLVIPRLRIARERPAHAVVEIPTVQIPADEPLAISVAQFADGRHVGGLCISKRHPEWHAEQIREVYRLLIRVLDAQRLRPLPRTAVKLFRWSGGQFSQTDRLISGADGAITSPNRGAGALDAAVLDKRGWYAAPHSIRALAGETVNLLMRAHKLKEATLPYTWRAGDQLAGFAKLSGHTAQAILNANELAAASDLKPRRRITLPCFAASHHMESGESFESLAEYYCCRGPKELAETNRVRSLSELAAMPEIALPGWRFLYARKGDTFEEIDAMFGLPRGWSRPAGRTFRPDPRVPFESEVIAVPEKRFISGRALRPWHSG